MTTQPTDFPTKLTNLATQGQLKSQLDPSEPQVAVLVLANDHRTILEAELRPLSEITAALAVHQPAKK